MESEKKQILLHLIRQTIQFIQQKPFLQINREKTFLLLKKQDTENLTQKKQRGKKPWLYFIKSLKKNHQMNKKTTSNQIRHCTTFLPTRTEATTCKKKTESTTNKNSPTTHATNDPIHSTKTFFTNQQGVLSFKTRESKIVSLSPVSFFEHKL